MNTDMSKSAVPIVKSVRQLGCVFQDIVPPESSPITTHQRWQTDEMQQGTSSFPTSEKQEAEYLA